MAFSVMGIMVLVLLGGILALAFTALTRLRLPRLGHATLTCPHCQQETRVNAPQCQHCARDLRG